MKYEKCESKVSNLLSGLDSLDDEDVNGKIRLLVEAIEILDQSILELARASCLRRHRNEV